ncbi:bifunctional diaminohydroxyphosphoribosylaminopyrimidine deaminase/5-amino-6-(5-phosphoribosylamino)uracil reductase RibD [Altibacter sp.]|uniref:bifunctional diaminohydroxyphosphoribosylaminopyrimidine deaminase/5-amino-6-(5-phosphoribosylamino)uracil reductase RibD n=1 Tax=Altibacter sp. TaxID=2024823 RepID=UPI002589AF65|nr:bifunctional diaminohydroxyphosphoribosylaminopyrimidine deaminase/5-amino-6-(5-phosphoribosylamino)uracil reductase RibD [Altibacter sp.]MCW9038619.1 bifunctional diaminohydroxyphosphoribosylaminopyrimidine deaminase/5-amino-6-(5-phosphoribosylamino)uracil reductase RibD [Altibacter sp.]
MPLSKHETYMMRCVQLARNGLGTSYPNPLVGSVIVHNDRIIGEGWHYKSGMAHAEVNAIESVREKHFVKEATLYVSLEPCSHYGKTPPCANLIIDSGIKKVVVGTLDPNPMVAGRGIQKLMEAGCDVLVGVASEACEELNKRFFTYHTKKRPYIFLKWAQTEDRYVAPSKELRTSKAPYWITGKAARQWSHKLRAEEQSILVGTQTVLDDDPGLTTRDWTGPSPLRIVIDRNLIIPETATVFKGDAETLIITEKEKEDTTTVQYATISFSENLPKQICEILHAHKVQSVIVEGGARTLESFIALDLWDEAYIFTGNGRFTSGILAPILSGRLLSEKKIKEDLLHHYKNPNT